MCVIAGHDHNGLLTGYSLTHVLLILPPATANSYNAVHQIRDCPVVKNKVVQLKELRDREGGYWHYSRVSDPH
jgi:hypothetical protein